MAKLTKHKPFQRSFKLSEVCLLQEGHRCITEVYKSVDISVTVL